MGVTACEQCILRINRNDGDEKAMKLMIWTRDEGITDDTFKDGDIFQVHEDTWVPGTLETQRWLVVKVDDYFGEMGELESSEYTVGPQNEPILRRLRKYRLNYVPKLTPEELTAARDPNTDLPVVEDRFSMTDIVRK